MKLSELPVDDLLPTREPIQLIDESGAATHAADLAMPDGATLTRLHRGMVIGRRFDRQATALTKQGRLAVYPSSMGQEACQVGAVLALGERDWLFPTYRDSMALVTHGVSPVETLTLLRGDWHCGYDPYRYRAAPQCTPLATNASHAVGLAHAARLRGHDVAVLVFIGDGATSEGDAHEAFNFAALHRCPVVFFIQNNQWAISVPIAKQNKAPTLAHKAIGYGMPGRYVDGNDVAAVHAVVSKALAEARAGLGPSIVEGVTFRMSAHTNADDQTRYRTAEQEQEWLGRDPIDRSARFLRSAGLVDEAAERAMDAEAEELASALRAELNQEPELDPAQMFAHVYTEPTQRLREQAAALAEEIARDGETA